MDKARAITAVAVVGTLVLFLAMASFVMGFAGFGVGEVFVMLAVGLALANFLVIVAAVVHALTRDDLGTLQRLVWVLLSVFVTPVVAVGAIVYFALGRERTRTLFSDAGAAPAR